MTEQSSYTQLSLGFAGMVQAAHLVYTIAQSGQIKNPNAFSASIHSIFQLSAANTTDIFFDRSHLQLGLEQSMRLLQGKADKSMAESTRYLMGMLYLEKKLSRDKQKTQLLTEKIQMTIEQLKFFSETHENTLARLAEIYVTVLGSFNHRIKIYGSELHLKNTVHVHQIRSLLLAGIRSAVLWRQLGGNRWKILLGRKKLLVACRHHLDDLL